MAQSLLDITNDFIALDELLAEVDGDISHPQVAETVERWFNELDENFNGKIDNYAAFISTLNLRSESRRCEADRLMVLVRRDGNTANFLKGRLKDALHARGMKKLETDRYCLSVCANGGKQPLDIHDPATIPQQLCKHIPESWEPDPDKIREHLAAGHELDGAILQPRGTHLRIL